MDIFGRITLSKDERCGNCDWYVPQSDGSGKGFCLHGHSPVFAKKTWCGNFVRKSQEQPDPVEKRRERLKNTPIKGTTLISDLSGR